MKIVLNDKLSPSTFKPWAPKNSYATPRSEKQQLVDFANTNFNKGSWVSEKRAMVYSANFTSCYLPEDIEAVHLGFIGLLSLAYDRHEKVRVTPHDLWFIVLTELAKIVNDNSDVCRPLFTKSDEKVSIVVNTNDITTIDPELIIEQLNRLSPTNPEIFMPSFSTATPEFNVAMAATFADMVQTYYSYGTMMCGIPEVEVTGSAEDWQACCTALKQIEQKFAAVKLPTGVVEYLNRVDGLFNTIRQQVVEQKLDLSFWKDIYTHKNVGSGGDLNVNGWIIKLFYKRRNENRLDSFLSTYGSFPYKNLETNREFKAYYGAFAQLRSPEGFIYSAYGSFVMEQPQ